MRTRIIAPLLISSILVATPFAARAYPVDDYKRTGISRLRWQYGIEYEGKHGRKMVPGGRWTADMIQLRMLEKGRDFEITPETPKDPALQADLEEILRKWSWRRYNVAILDITDPLKPRYAGVNEHETQTPGSVAKIEVAAAMLEQLKQRFPDVAKREELLRTHKVTADDWAKSDSHEVPVPYGENLEKASSRKIRTGDTFTLWEWMDHALSASNNSAASTLWREATLMKLLGDQYPPEKYDAELWKKWDKETLTAASFDVVDKPLVDAGIDPEVMRLRLYFTTGANRYIKSKSCGATPFTIIQWMLKVEQGRMVDEFSSLELKKMLYLTRRRVRYFYTKTLNDFGAFFKTGSLYRFSENAERIQYQGDLVNVLNAMVEVDTTPPPPEPIVDHVKQEKTGATVPTKVDGITAAAPVVAKAEKKATPHVYIIAVMSNELKRNAALDHAKLAEAIHEIVTKDRTASATE